MGKVLMYEAEKKTDIKPIDNQSTNNLPNGVIGRLGGTFADYSQGTRNGGRIYPHELWINRVLNNEDVLESLNTLTLFGEVDHPQDDRVETLAYNAAISIYKLEDRPMEQIIYGEAYILDTPSGRIVKSILDTGAQLGVSSRGLGEETVQNGELVINPETYDFITFDVVVTPANIKARVSLLENKQKNSLMESIKKEINNATTLSQLSQIKEVVQNVHLEKALSKELETKQNDLTKQPIKESIKRVNKEIAYNLFKEALARRTKQVKTFKDINTTQLVQKLESDKKAKVEQDKLQESLSSLKNQVNELIEARKQQLNTINQLNIKTKMQENQIIKLQKTKDTLVESNSLNIKELQEKIQVLTENLAQKDKQLAQKDKQLKEKDNQITSQSKELLENKSNLSKIVLSNQTSTKELQSRVTKLNESKTSLAESLTQREKEIAELKKTIDELEETNRTLKDLPFMGIGNAQIVTEPEEELNTMTAEEQALFEALTRK